MRIIGLIILLLTIAFLTFSFTFFKTKSRDYVVIADEISKNVADKLSKKHQMVLVGNSKGMMKSVNLIGLIFEIHHRLDRINSRQMILDCAEEFLSAINSNEEIRPFLKNYPFTTKNLQLSIISVNPKGGYFYDPDITVVSIDESDYITFRTEEPSNPNSYKNRYKELYSEALSALKKDEVK